MRRLINSRLHPSHRHDRERGAVMVLSAIALVSLIGAAALVLDVAALAQERRTLQNGADAAVLAVAQDCARNVNCNLNFATAQSYANQNADDNTSTIDFVCGQPVPLTGCAAPPPLPSGVTTYAMVRTSTRTTGGSSQVPFHLARVLGINGATVRRTAVAAWGGPGSLTSSLPVTFSACEYNFYTNNGTTFTTPTPTGSAPWPAGERVILFHTKSPMPSGCPASGSGADLPGGFGWLRTITGCQAFSSAGNWFADSTGNTPPNSCSPAAVAALRGQIIFIPIFDHTNGLNGNNGQYHVLGFAAFYLTGYFFSGQFNQGNAGNSLVTGARPCNGNDRCISGYFLGNQLVPGGGTIGGPSMGAVVVQVVG